MYVFTVLLLYFLIFQLTNCSCHSDPAFGKEEVVEKLETCKSAVDQFECVDELRVKPANLLLNFGYSVGFVERFGMRLDVSQSAHELYQNCTQNLLDAMPDFYSIEVQKLMNIKHYEGKCFTREELCRLNRAYLYPFICLARKHCSAYFSEAFYALVYANQQLSLETNEQLKCTEHHDQDLMHDVYTRGFVFKRGRVVSRHFCRNIANPPRLVIHESSAENFKITIGLEYYW